MEAQREAFLQLKPKGYVWFVACVAAMGGLIFGYDIGGSGGTFVFAGFRSHFHWDPVDNTPDEKLDMALISVFFTIGALCGCLPAQILNDKVGRKMAMMIEAAIFTIGVTIQMSTPENMMPMLFVGRFIGGFAIGAMSTLVPSYVAEVAPTSVKGMMNTTWQYAITIGIVLAGGLNLAFRNFDAGWRFSYGGNGFASVLMIILLFKTVESPRWLLMKGREEEARAVMARLRHPEEIDMEIYDIQQELEVSARAGKATWGAMFASERRMKYRSFLAMMFPVWQQMGGMNAIMFFAPTILKEVFNSEDAALYGNLIIQAVNCVCTTFCVLWVDKYGRKTLMTWGGAIMFLSAALVGAMALGPYQTNPAVGWGIVVFCCFYVFAFAWGWGPIMWIYCGEIFPTSHRSKGCFLTAAGHWIFATVIGQCTPFLYDAPGFGIPGTFFLFAVIVLLGTAFFNFYLVETAGISLENTDETFESFQPKFDKESLKWKKHV
ncbi:MAG: hypothetical protein KVP17_001819 [Porospora cf. gigantea B]|nr:MAG: hypothetical protein KVP17_001819 [Porospora cf. gigantea B]